MQLFISSLYTKDQNNIAITDERIVHQCFHVLRYKSGQTLQLQDNGVRYTLSIAHISKKEIQTHIQSTEIANSTLITHNLQLCIALPNRREKAELIVQKLTEIGIDNIIIRTADRSILRDIPEKKLQRLQSIALEAAEQSFRRSLPTITYLDNLFESTILSSGQVVLFHQDGVSANQLNTSNLSADKAGSKLITSLIGPEGGFSANELYKFSTLSNCVHINLGDTILRMETAAIIGSRLLKNL